MAQGSETLRVRRFASSAQMLHFQTILLHFAGIAAADEAYRVAVQLGAITIEGPLEHLPVDAGAARLQHRLPDPGAIRGAILWAAAHWSNTSNSGLSRRDRSPRSQVAGSANGSKSDWTRTSRAPAFS